MLGAMPGNALPSYAQQTGLPCAQCHSIGFGPALTAYGRQFKLNAYALGEHKPFVPLALMTVVGYTQTSAALPEAPEHFSTNNNFAMNELTGFIAGGFGEHRQDRGPDVASAHPRAAAESAAAPSAVTASAASTMPLVLHVVLPVIFHVWFLSRTLLIAHDIS